MKRIQVSALVVAALFGTLVISPSANAGVLISDHFSGTNNDTINGRTPDTVDVPATTFTATNQGNSTRPFIDTSTGNPSPSANTTYNGASFISITKPAGLNSVAISADVQVNTIIEANGNTYRGVALGYYSSAITQGTESNTNFTGLVVNPDGTLRLEENGVGTAVTAGPFSGFSANNFYNLSYTANTVTGSITSVTFNGNDYTSIFSGATTAGVFTNALTNLPGFYGSTDTNTAFFGRVDNFTVTATPEPSSFILGGLGVVGLLIAARRRRKA